jgi:hypothetical protein
MQKIQSQPITVYITDDTHLGHVTQQNLKIMPIAAQLHITASSTGPLVFLKAIRQIGV